MKNRIPILDAGHGGVINGKYTTGNKKYYHFTNTGVTIYEGIVNRDIALRVAEKLSAKGIKFYEGNIYDNKDKPLSQRAAEANNIYVKDRGAYFLSIHSNAASDSLEGEGTKATGFEILVYNKSGVTGIISSLAENIYKAKFPGVAWRGIKIRPDLGVLRKTVCPALVVENLFFDNPREANYLLSIQGQEDISDCLVDIIEKIYNSDI